MNQEARREKLQSLVTLIRKQGFPYQEREPTPRNWAEYDEAQIHEMNDVLNLLRELVDHAQQRLEVPTKKRPPGRPPTPSVDVVKVLLAQSYFGAANRVAQGFHLLFREKLGIREDFSYKTVERAYDYPAVNRLLDQVFLLTNEPVRGLETIFSTDGSGFSTTVRDHYARDREQQRSKNTDASDTWAGEPRRYVYNVAVIGVKYKVLAGWVSRAKNGEGEHTLFPVAMQQLAKTQDNIESVLGDGIFATRPCCRVVAELGAKPRFMPKRNATFKSHGVTVWTRMLADLLDHPQAWLAEYHLRSNSETGFSVLKHDNPQPLRKRLDPRKETEAYLRAIVYNVKRLCYLAHQADIHPLPAAAQ